MTWRRYDNLTEQEWHALRARVITSTEVAALFGLSPYETEFELWHRKKKGEQKAVEKNERMKWGTRLQDSIAIGLAEDSGWEVQSAAGVFIVGEDRRMGASFDYFIEEPESARGPLEIKNVDSLAFKQGWKVDENGEVEAPPHIELQVQMQMLCSGSLKAKLGVLVGGNTVKVLDRLNDAGIQQSIKDKIAAFWRSIDSNTPPAPDFLRDAEVLKAIYADADDGKVMQADNGTEIASLTAQLATAKAELKRWEDTETALKSHLLTLIGDAAKVVTPYGTISCGTTKPNPGKIVTQDMVGTYIGARSATRPFRFYPVKEGK